MICSCEKVVAASWSVVDGYARLRLEGAQNVFQCSSKPFQQALTVSSVGAQLLRDLLEVRTTNKGDGALLAELLERLDHLRRGRKTGGGEGSVDIKHADGLGELALRERLDTLREGHSGGDAEEVREGEVARCERQNSWEGLVRRKM